MMVSHKKTALIFIGLISLTACQPVTIPEYDSPSYGGETLESEEESTAVHRERVVDSAEEATDHQGFNPAEFNLDNKQLGISSIASTLISLVMSIVRPLLTNLGIGTSNAVLATVLRRRLTLISETLPSVSNASYRQGSPTATVR